MIPTIRALARISTDELDDFDKDEVVWIRKVDANQITVEKAPNVWDGLVYTINASTMEVMSADDIAEWFAAYG